MMKYCKENKLICVKSCDCPNIDYATNPEDFIERLCAIKFDTFYGNQVSSKRLDRDEARKIKNIMLEKAIHRFTGLMPEIKLNYLNFSKENQVLAFPILKEKFGLDSQMGKK